LDERATDILRKWIVAAGIKDDNIQAVFRIAHGLQHHFGFDPFRRNLVLLLDVVVHWDQEIFPIDLDAVAGEIEQAHTSKLDGIAELTDRISHLALRGILDLGDSKSERPQRRRHGLRVVHRVHQW
jgi:hypothetical protein